MLIKHQPHRNSSANKGFTLVELLVVIAIIVLLIGILLPALAAASAAAKNTKTSNTMNEFAKACDLFYQEHGFYPGVFTEYDLFREAESAGDLPLSSTENALLHLMGGWIAFSDPNYANVQGVELDINGTKIKIPAKDVNGTMIPTEIGTGSIINGRQYGAYFTPGNDEFGYASGQAGEDDIQLPDLLDGWGNPIVFVRRANPLGFMFTDAIDSQFHRHGANPYLLSTQLGESNQNQTDSSGYEDYSLFNVNGNSTFNTSMSMPNWNLMQMIGHQGFMQGSASNQDLTYSAARGEYFLISAGADGIYFSRTDGFGSTGFEGNSGAVDEIPTAATIGEWDDLVLTGGGGG